MAIYGPAPGLHGRTFEVWVHNRWVFNFCVRSTPLRKHAFWKIATDRYLIVIFICDNVNLRYALGLGVKMPQVRE